MSLPSYADAPFHCPSDIIIDLPAPPSVNRLWLIGKGARTKLSVSRSAVYQKWLKEADGLCMEMGQLRGVKRVEGKFEAIIVLKRSGVDLDNHAKGVLDWAQSRDVIANDKFCECLLLMWGDAPHGARLYVRPLSSENGGAG